MTRLAGEDRSAASFLDWLGTPAKHVPLPVPEENREGDGKPTERVIFLPGGGKIILSSGGDFDPGIRPTKKMDKTGAAGNRNLTPQKLGHIPLDSSVLPGSSGLMTPGDESHAKGSSKRSHRRMDPSRSSAAHF